MKIQFVEIHNFKSFREGWEKLHFSDLSDGLYFVSGENQIEPGLGSNGAGKSALFEAICWCLYGKTSANLRAGNVVSWGNDGCQVVVGFEELTICRGQAPNFLKMDEQPVTQDEVEAKLGLGFESFLYSTFVSQFSQKFFDLSPADKLVVFSDIMSELLQPWLSRSEHAKILAREADKQIGELKLERATAAGKLEQLQSEDYSQRIADYEKKRQAELSSMRIEAEGQAEQKQKYGQELKKLVKDRVQLVVQSRKLDRKLGKEGAFPLLAEMKQKLEDTQKKLRSEQVDITALKRWLNDIDATEGYSICPTCFQEVDEKLLLKKRREKQQLIKRHQEHEGELQKQIALIQERLNKMEEEKERWRQEVSINRGDLAILDNNTTQLKRLMQSLELSMQKLTRMRQERAQEDNPYIRLEKEQSKNKRALLREIKERDDALVLAEKEQATLSYWVKGFKEIRLLLMYEALKELEVFINNNLSQFGMGGWNVKLDVDQENKSGTVRKGFSVLVESPDHSGPVPFEVWSGGEGQRLRLAGTFGLMDLIQAKRQSGFGIEIFDEPTAWLSEQGIDNLLDILYYRAKEQGKKIFIIDHKDLYTYGGFSGVVNITKTAKGSVISYQ